MYYDVIRIPYYYAVFMEFDPMTGSSTFAIADKNSHPFISLKIYKEQGRNVTLLNWQPITQDEYEYYISK
jgi:hypothetical protein